ncbi:Hydroxyacid oxidase 1, partial [Ilyodon furcidens]
LDVLEEVVKAVQGRCDVFMDGGVRRGTDILKALALGAKAVFIGRPVLWGLACQGEEGVIELLELLKEELRLALALSGLEIGLAILTHGHALNPNHSTQSLALCLRSLSC